MSFRIDLPPAAAATDPKALYAYMARTVPMLNYALSFLDVPDATADAGLRAEDPNNKSAKINENSTNTQYPTARAVYEYAVPQTRKVNDKTLNEDITLSAGDVGAVPTDRKINEHALSSDLTLAPADLGEADYITETGSNNDGWQWRKWSSGVVDLWVNNLQVSLGTFTAWTTELSYATGTISLPITFASNSDLAAHVSVSDRDNVDSEVNALLLITRKRKDSMRIRVVRKSSSASIRVDVCVRGKEAAAT